MKIVWAESQISHDLIEWQNSLRGLNGTSVSHVPHCSSHIMHTPILQISILFTLHFNPHFFTYFKSIKKKNRHAGFYYCSIDTSWNCLVYKPYSLKALFVLCSSQLSLDLHTYPFLPTFKHWSVNSREIEVVSALQNWHAFGTFIFWYASLIIFIKLL